MRSLRWEAEAARQFNETLAYIAAVNPDAANSLADEVGNKLELTLRFAEIGRKGRVPRTRELVVHPNYLVIYTVRRNTIDVIRFLHARRQYP